MWADKNVIATACGDNIIYLGEELDAAQPQSHKQLTWIICWLQQWVGAWIWRTILKKLKSHGNTSDLAAELSFSGRNRSLLEMQNMKRVTNVKQCMQVFTPPGSTLLSLLPELKSKSISKVMTDFVWAIKTMIMLMCNEMHTKGTQLDQLCATCWLM